jgi:diacylglycerol kinase (ATP)
MPEVMPLESAGKGAPIMVAWGTARIAKFRKAALIYNPYAGRVRRRPQLLDEIDEALKPLAGEWAIRATGAPGDATQLAAEAVAGGADLVVSLGGDGTLNEVIQGMAGSDAVLGILPAGTANVLAVETGIGRDPLRAARRMDGFREAEVPLGCLTGAAGAPRWFAVMAGVGLDARIVRQVKPETKRRLGKLSYWTAGFGTVGERLPEFAVRVDGRDYRASYALFSRVKNYGGDLEIARHAELLRDDLAVVLFEGESSFRYLKYFLGIVCNRLCGMSGVHLLHGREAEVLPLNGRPVDLQLDGEYAGVAPGRVSVGAARVRMLLPERFLRGRVAG